MNDFATSTGAVVAAANGGALAAAVSACAGSQVGAVRVWTHMAKPVEVAAIAGSELCQARVADHPAWVRELSQAARLVVSDRRFTLVSGSESHGLKVSHHGGAPDWLVKWPDGRLEIFDDTDFNLRFSPREVAP